MPSRQRKKIIKSIPTSLATFTTSVFSQSRTIQQPKIALPPRIEMNTRQKMDGITLLRLIPDTSIVVSFFDPQYRGVLDKLKYGNEGKKRGQARASLAQMSDEVIAMFLGEIDRVMIPSGHCFLWVDKYHLCNGIQDWIAETSLEVVDLIVWNKDRMGMGYRTRRYCEYLFVLQKPPTKAKGVWSIHTIADIWTEKIDNGNGVHPKPIKLQAQLIEAVSNIGDLVIDPAAGSFSVLEACKQRKRNFIGCDING